VAVSAASPRGGSRPQTPSGGAHIAPHTPSYLRGGGREERVLPCPQLPVAGDVAGQYEFIAVNSQTTTSAFHKIVYQQY